MQPLIEHDGIILGIFLIILAVIFHTGQLKNRYWKKFYDWVPALLLCYLFPSALNSLGIISGEQSKLYTIASQYLLPAALIWLTSSADIRSILRLGNKALLVFLAGTLGVIIGGPIALYIVTSLSPAMHQTAIEQEWWKGLITITGSWIGGSSSQIALKEVYGCSEAFFVIILIVDAIVANVWTACLIYGAAYSGKIDYFLKADNSSIEAVKERILQYKQPRDKAADMVDLATILAVGFGGAAVAQALAKGISTTLQPHTDWLKTYGLEPFTGHFLWVIILSTTLGIVLSFTKVRRLEKLGTTDLSTLFVYFLIMTIGMRLNLANISGNGGLFLVAIIWIIIHALFSFIAAKWLKAPYFFVAVGSQANIGGVSTAPAVASVFHPVLAPVGVLLAVLSHILGTYGGIISAWLFKLAL
jgi:uncharacterized membrane protein